MGIGFGSWRAGLGAMGFVLALGGCMAPEPAGLAFECLPPEVIAVTPGPGETDVPLDAEISIVFDAPPDSASLNPHTLVLLLGGDTIPGTITYDPGDTSVVFDPTDSLLPDTLYTFVITTGVHDTAGIALDTPFTWTFSTADTLPPPPDGVAEVFPEPGDEDVPLDEDVQVTLDTVFHPSVFDSNAIVLTLDGDTIPGTVTYDPGDSTLVFDPVDSLMPETTYTVTVTLPTGSVTAGGPVDTTITWTFTTVDPAPNPPVPEAVNNGATYSLSSQPDAFLRLYWFPAAGPTATTYRLQVSTNPAFATTVYDVGGLPNNSFIVMKAVPHALLSPGLHYWRVSASNAGGTSGWSAVWTFTVTP